MNEYIVHEGDIVITRVGTMGIVRLIGKELDGYAVSDNINIIKVNKIKIAPEYLYAILYSELGRKFVKKVSKGSVQHYNTPKAIKNINIPILSEPEYSQIIDSVKDSETHRIKAVDGISEAGEVLETFLHYK